MIPGAKLLRTDPRCLEDDKELCGKPSSYEVWSMMDGTWGAHCAKCKRYYATDMVREMSDDMRVRHILAQLSSGTIPESWEPHIVRLASASGMTVKEYCELAFQASRSDVLLSAMTDLHPKAHFEIWAPAGKGRLDALVAEAGEILNDEKENPF